MDTTDTLREIIRQDLDDVVFFGIYDPDAVQQAIQATVQTISAGSFRLKGGLTPGLASERPSRYRSAPG
jgi:microcystin degradation protein MlrC